VESSLGFNRQTTGKKAISSAGSSTDWLGYDNSFREHDHNSFVQLVNYPIPQKTELFALGLGPYYASLGITASSAGWTETDFKLGLVQLGILKKDLFNDPAAVKAAELAYDKGPYHGKAFDVINAGAIKSNLTFPNTWNTVNRKAPPALYQSISISNQVKLFGRPLGILGGLQYSSFTQYDPHAVFYNLVNAVIINGAIRDDTVNQVISKETNSWSALFQADYQLNPNNSLSLLFMPNVSGVNTARTGISNTDLNHPLTARQQILQEYESRKQLIYQLRTEHYLPGPKAKMQLDVSYTRGNSNAPDIRSVFMPIGLAKNGNDLGGERSWQYFSDHVFDSRLSAEWPLNKAEQRLQRKMKLGLDFFRNDKRTDQYNYWIREDYDEWFTPGHSTADPFGPDVFASKPWKDGNANIHAVQKYYTYIGAPVNHNFGHSTEKAVYGLTDAELTSRLRFTGGLRIEQTLIFWDVNKYDSMKLPVDDPRRHWFDSQVLNNPVNINSVNYLPSAGLIYKLNKNEHYPFLLRLNYSQTIGKPSLREVASMNTYDFNLQSATLGNPDLKLERINNTDLRAEWYVKTGDYLSLSVFYKDFRNNIELVNFGPIYGYTWVNNDNIAWVKGIELDARKKIGAHVEIAANATWAESRSHFQKRFPSQSGGSIPLGMADHPMFGQAPYVLNALLSYTSSELGFSATCIYSVQGPRLVLDGWGDFPNVYEMPRHLLDVMISKTLSKHLTLRLKVKDLLNSPTERRYKFAEGYRLGYDKYTYGTNFIVSALYKF
jgi:outer membrane receptor protein involved in Fe transport